MEGKHKVLDYLGNAKTTTARVFERPFEPLSTPRCESLSKHVSGQSTDRKIKQVLVIAYYFPPCGGGGVQRTAKFVRYLPDFGWMPTVLTVATSSYGDNIDLSHVADLSDDVEIIRIPEIQTIGDSGRLAGRMKRMTTHLRKKSARIPLLRRVGAFVEEALANSPRFHPRKATRWCLRVVRAGLKAHRRKRFDLIYATGEPYSDFVIAWMLSNLMRVPYVLDMRDPWTLNPYMVERGSGFPQMFQRWEERLTLASCSACVFANSSIAAYAEQFPRWKTKFYHIPNGYDSADLDQVVAKRFDKFTIVHNGNLLPGYRTADTFLLALRDLSNAHPDLRHKIQVLFVGAVGPEEKLVRDLALDGAVQHLGYLPHRQSLEFLKGADLLLLIGGRHRWEETGKVYEYLASGKSILAVLRPDGAATDLLRQCPIARIVDRENVAEISTALAEMLAKGLVAQSRPSGELTTSTSQWERRTLTKRLAEILNACV